MPTLTTRDIGARFRSALYQDTVQTGGRGAPNAISPASDSNNYTLAGGGAGTWSYVAGATDEIQFSGATNVAYAVLGSSTIGDVNISVRFSVTAGGDAAGVVLRYSGVNNHYRVRYGSSTIAIIVDNAGTVTNLASTSFTITAGTFYWIRAKAIGPYLFGRIWADGSAEPSSWTVTATDSTFTTGQCGYFVNLGGVSRNAQFDHFSVSNGIGLNVPHDLGTRFRLQAVSSRDIGARFRLAATVLRDLGTRFRLSLGNFVQHDLFSRFRSAIYQDTVQTGGRGSPNAISPASDGENYSFAGVNQAGWTYVVGTPSVVQFSGSASGAAYALLGNNTLGDLEMVAQVTISSGTDVAGLVFRYTNVNNHYRVRFTNNLLAITLQSGGSATTVASVAVTVTAGIPYWLKVRAIGPFFYVKWWDASTSEPTTFTLWGANTILGRGQFGLFANMNATLHTARFSNLAIYDVVPLYQRDMTSRFLLKAVAPRDILSRFPLQAISPRDITTRFLLRSFPSLRDSASRFLLQAIAPRDLGTRFRLSSSTTVLRDLATRFRLQSQPTLRDIFTRFRLGLVSQRDLSSRFRSAIYQDTAQTSGRGAPNNISPASDGENYTLSGGNGGSWSWVSGTTNELQFTLSSNAAYAILGTSSIGDSDMLVRFTVSNLGDAAGMVFRYSGNNNHYRVRYASSAFALLVISGGTTTSLVSTAFTLTPNSFYWIRAKVVGPYLFGKIWADGSPEPSSWSVSVTDTTFSSGQFGLFSSLNGTLHTAQYDSFSVGSGLGLAPRDIGTRFRLQTTRVRDLAIRFRLQSVPLRDITSRIRVAAASPRDIGIRFSLKGPPLRDLATRFRLQSLPTPKDIKTRFRLQVISPRDIGARFRVSSLHVRDALSRFLLKSQPTPRDLPARFRLQGFQTLSVRSLSTRFVLGLPASQPVTGPLPQVQGFAGSGQVYPILPPPESAYAVNGTVLPTQPYVCTAPLAEGAGTLPQGATFLLLFNNPDSTTQTLLASTTPVSLSFYLPSGELVTVSQVRLSHTLSGSTYQVTATLLAPFSINVWVVKTQLL